MPMVLDQTRLARAKRAFTTRRVPDAELQLLLGSEDMGGRRFRAGDVALARVERIGHHARIERCDGRRARLFEGDEIILAIGPRYAPDQYEAFTPEALGPCQLAAAGGVAGRIAQIHERILHPTEISLLGLIGSRAHRPINLRDHALESAGGPASIPAIAVVGTAMNSGKTTVAAGLIRGLAKAGRRVGAAKITGTGAGGDHWHFRDAGAAHVVDFVDAGFVATYLEPVEALEAAAATLLRDIEAQGCDVAVLEISDGLAQRETAALLQRDALRALSPRVVFAAREASGAVHGVRWLRARGFDVACVSGVITNSPLAVREFEGEEGAVRCLTHAQLCEPVFAEATFAPPAAAAEAQTAARLEVAV